MTAHLAKKLALAYVACLVVFSLLLVGAFAIPTSQMRDNAERSLATLQDEGMSKRFVGITPAWQVDNYTTAIMINIATHGDGMGAYGAFSAFYYDDPGNEDEKIESLAAGLAKEADPSDPHWASYARYWNGWASILKPLLLVCDLALMRTVSLALLAVLAIALLITLGRRIGVGALAVIVALLAVNAPIAAASPSLSFSVHLALVACIAISIVQGPATEGTHSAGRTTGIAVLFFVVGATTTYLDFLCTPLLTLGMPLAVHIALRRDAIKGPGGLGRQLASIASLCVAWGLGYALLWASKWLLSTAICGWNVVGDAGFSAAFRTSDVALGAKHTVLGVIRQNMQTWLPLWALATIGILWALLVIFLFIRTKRAGLPCHWAAFLSILAVATLPLAWYAALPNHSWTHAWYTYRDLAISLGAMLLALWALVPPGALARREPAHRTGRSAGASQPLVRGQAVSGRQHSRSLAYEDDETFFDDYDYDPYDDE